MGLHPIKIEESASLSDYDIAVFSPNLDYTDYYHDNDGYEGKSLYNKSSSARILEDTKHWNKEISNFLKSGKTLFVNLKHKEDFYVYSGQKTFSGTGKSRQPTYHVQSHSNYDFLPYDGNVHNAKGRILNVANNLISSFYNDFKDYINYEAYVDSQEVTILFTTRNKDRVLGCYKKVSTGYLIFIPYLDFNVKSLIDEDKETGEENWNSKAIQIGKRFAKSLVDFDTAIRKDIDKTPKPKWADSGVFNLKDAEKTKKEIEANTSKIRSLETKNRELNEVLVEQESLKDLLFESGKPLEQAVIKALKILGYQAESYDDGTLELDQVILSPEKIRFIGECEGRDNKDIDIGKFRQLLDSLNEDFEREEIDEKALGLLFGNPMRLVEPQKRGIGFTTKCIKGAQREKIGLVKTFDLYKVCKKILEEEDDVYKASCRNSIFEQLGNVIEFPDS